MAHRPIQPASTLYRSLTLPNRRLKPLAEARKVTPKLTIKWIRAQIEEPEAIDEGCARRVAGRMSTRRFFAERRNAGHVGNACNADIGRQAPVGHQRSACRPLRYSHRNVLDEAWHCTGVAASGTVEEIDRFVAAGKPAMLYFSQRKAAKGKVDPKQTSQVAKI